MVGAEQTKERILKAAIEIFARDGFAGAHVAEIAERAEVNVALLYRYFGSKEDLLQAVLDQFIEAARPQREQLLARQALPSTGEELRALARWGWQYMEQRRDLIKIVLSESLQDHGHNELLFHLFDTMLQNLPPALTERRDEEALQLGMTVFFFGLTPFLMALAIGEQWATYYGVDPERVPEYFSTAFEATYARYVLDWLAATPTAGSETENENRE